MPLKSGTIIFKTLSLGYYAKYPSRWILCVLGVAIGVAVSTSINLTSSRAVFSFSETIETLSGKANLQLTSPNNFYPEELSKLTFLWYYGYFSPFITVNGSSNKIAVKIYGFDFLGDKRIREYKLNGKSDNYIQQNPIGGIIVPVDSPLGKVGDTVSFVINAKTYSFPIVGIIEAINGKLPPLNSAFCDLSLLLPIQKKISGIDIFINPDSIQTVSEKLKKEFPAAWVQTIQERKKSTNDMFSAFQMNLQALGLIALLVSAYLVYNTMNISVVRRRQYISTLLSLGADRVELLLALLAEGASFGLIGGLLGILFGGLLSSITYDEVSFTLTTALQLNDSKLQFFSINAIAVSLLTGIAFSILAAWYPAWKGSQLSISQSVKRGFSEFSSSKIKKSSVYGIICLFLGFSTIQLAHVYESPLFGYCAVVFSIGCLSFFAPVVTLLVSKLFYRISNRGEVLLAYGSIKEHIVKVSVAVAALAMALSMAGSVSIMVNSFRTTIIDWLDKNIQADIYIKSVSNDNVVIGTLSPEIQTILKNQPNTVDVLSLRNTQVLFQGKPVDIGANEMQQLFNLRNFKLDNGDIPEKTIPRGVFISEVFANKFKQSKNDSILIQNQWFYVQGVYRNYSSDRGFILMDVADFISLFGYRDPTALAVYLKPEVDQQKTLLQFRQILKNYEVDLSLSSKIKNNALRIFDQVFRMTMLLQLIALGIAVLSVVTTLLSMILERKKDLAVLQAFGSLEYKLNFSLIIESLIIAVSSLISAAFGSFILSKILIEIINRYSFGWTIVTEIPFLNLFITGFVLIILASLATLYPMRLIKRQNLPTILKGNYEG